MVQKIDLVFSVEVLGYPELKKVFLENTFTSVAQL